MKRLELRHLAACRVCAVDIAPGTEAWWDSASHDATCLSCAGRAAIATADSASRTGTDDFDLEWDKGVDSHQAKVALDAKHREDEIRERHPHLGGLFVSLFERFRSERPPVED